MNVMKCLGISVLALCSMQGVAQSLPLNEMNLTDASCADAFCVTAGMYVDEQGNNKPVLAQTNNAGETWQTITAFENLPEAASFEKVSCSSAACLVVGDFQVSESSKQPMIVRTVDQGKTWQVETMFDAVPAHSIFEDVNCDDETCVIVGGSPQPDSALYQPLNMQTTNRGDSWNVTHAIGYMPTDTNDFNAPALVSCAKGFCVSIRYANVDSSFASFLVQSANGGVTWENLMPMTGYHLSDISCTASICTVVGNDLLMQSVDKGMHWKSISAPGLSHPTSFYDTKCSGNSCVIVGNGTSLLRTSNAGQSWAVEQIKTNAPPLSGWNASCSDKFCVAASRLDDGYTSSIVAERVAATGAWELNGDGNVRASDVLCTNDVCIAYGKNLSQSNAQGSSWKEVDLSVAQ